MSMPNISLTLFSQFSDMTNEMDLWSTVNNATVGSYLCQNTEHSIHNKYVRSNQYFPQIHPYSKTILHISKCIQNPRPFIMLFLFLLAGLRLLRDVRRSLGVLWPGLPTVAMLLSGWTRPLYLQVKRVEVRLSASIICALRNMKIHWEQYIH